MDIGSYMDMIKGALGLTTAAATSIDTSLKVVKGIKDLRKVETPATIGQADEQLMDLREQLLAIRAHNLELKEMLLTVQTELGKREKFEAEASDYILAKFEGNSLAYVLKSPVTEAEKSLRLCANCFSNNVKSILQFESVDVYFDILKCPTCSSKIRVRNNIDMTSMTAGSRRNWDGFI